MRQLFLIIPCALAVAACGYDNGDDAPSNPTPVHVEEVPIDLNGLFSRPDLGQGQGTAVRVEYGPPGHWHVFTTCDTTLSGYPCTWDIFLTVPDGSRVESIKTESFEKDDWIFWQGLTTGEFSPVTDTDVDGVSFDTEPGQPLRVEAYLDDPGYTEGAKQFIYWISGGVGNRGAPTNPIDFVPPPP